MMVSPREAYLKKKVSNMTKKHWLVIGIGLTLLGMLGTKLVNDWQIRQFHAEKSNPRPKTPSDYDEFMNSRPECFKKEILHVRIGGKEYAFPRKMIRSLYGEEVRHMDYKGYLPAGSASMCQQENEVWNVRALTLDMYPEECESIKQCNAQNIDVYMSDMNYIKLSDFNIKPTSKEELLKSCHLPNSPLSEWHAKVWSVCHYNFVQNDLYLRIGFRGGIYPPKEIEQTKIYIMKRLQQYQLSSQ